MPNDIQLAVSGTPIKNGTILVCLTTGKYSVINTYVNNKPILSDIDDKYDSRFDEPRYYAGDSAS